MNGRVTEVRRLVHEHLNASMIMVPLDAPINESLSVVEALSYLEEQGFDLALLSGAKVRVVYRDRLRSTSRAGRDRRVSAFAEAPRSNRLIEHSLDLGEVVERLTADPIPLLVVGRNGPEYIVTRSDFTRPAGRAGILAVIAALDGELDAVLQPHDHEVWAGLSTTRRREIEALVDRARKRDAEIPRCAYLYLSERLAAVRRLRLDHRYRISLGTQNEHESITSIRNDIAHGRDIGDGLAAMRALALCETYLDQLSRIDPVPFDPAGAPAEYLRRLVGAELRTVSGRVNRVLALVGDDVLVATERSPDGRPVPLDTIREALERLSRERELTIDVHTLGYRSAFVGAVALTLPGAAVRQGSPSVVSLPSG